MPIIYGMLVQKGTRDRAYEFLYVDEDGNIQSIERMSWTGVYNMDVLRVMYQLSLEGWECFSVVTRTPVDNIVTIATYYFKKHVG